MVFIELLTLPPARQAIWIDRIAQGNWRAAPYLAQQLRCDNFQKLYGPNARVLLLTEADKLISFCTLVRQDEIPDPSLFPWIGFVYTFPEYRGNRQSEELIRHACDIARSEGHRIVYLSSDEKGLYEKYGFTLYGYMAAKDGKPTQVFTRNL